MAVLRLTAVALLRRRSLGAAAGRFGSRLLMLWNIGLLRVIPIEIVSVVHCLSFLFGLFLGYLYEKLRVFSVNAFDNDMTVMEMNDLA